MNFYFVLLSQNVFLHHKLVKARIGRWYRERTVAHRRFFCSLRLDFPNIIKSSSISLNNKEYDCVNCAANSCNIYSKIENVSLLLVLERIAAWKWIIFTSLPIDLYFIWIAFIYVLVKRKIRSTDGHISSGIQTNVRYRLSNNVNLEMPKTSMWLPVPVLWSVSDHNSFMRPLETTLWKFTSCTEIFF